MTLASDLVLGALRALQAQLVRVRAHRAQLEAAYGTGDVALAKEGVHGLRRALDDLAVTYLRLRRHVVAFEGAVLDPTIGSFGELALRAEALLVAAQRNEISFDAEPDASLPAGPAGRTPESSRDVLKQLLGHAADSGRQG